MSIWENAVELLLTEANYSQTNSNYTLGDHISLQTTYVYILTVNMIQGFEDVCYCTHGIETKGLWSHSIVLNTIYMI